MQLFAKFQKKFVNEGFRATLNFQKFKVSINPSLTNFFETLPKVASPPAYQNSIIRKNFTVPFFEKKIRILVQATKIITLISTSKLCRLHKLLFSNLRFTNRDLHASLRDCQSKLNITPRKPPI